MERLWNLKLPVVDLSSNYAIPFIVSPDSFLLNFFWFFIKPMISLFLIFMLKFLFLMPWAVLPPRKPPCTAGPKLRIGELAVDLYLLIWAFCLSIASWSISICRPYSCLWSSWSKSLSLSFKITGRPPCAFYLGRTHYFEYSTYDWIGDLKLLSKLCYWVLF